MFDRAVPGESRKERQSRRRSNFMTAALLVVVVCIIAFMAWVAFFIAPDVALWSRP